MEKQVNKPVTGPAKPFSTKPGASPAKPAQAKPGTTTKK
jgi:hypothetical protein